MLGLPPPRVFLERFVVPVSRVFTLLQGTVHRAENAKIAVFGCGIEATSTETKGTVRPTGRQSYAHASRVCDFLSSTFCL